MVDIKDGKEIVIPEKKEVNPKSALIVQTIKQVESNFTPEKLKEEKLFILNDLLKDEYKYSLFAKNPNSLRNALIDLSASKLTLNPVLKYCYLVPRKNEITLMISYKGLIKLLVDNGTVKSVKAHEVYECDTFEVFWGSEERIIHKPNLLKRDESKVVYFYSKATLHNDIDVTEVMTVKEINRIKNCAMTKNIWDSWFEEMAKKTVIKRLLKNIVVSDFIAEIIEKDNQVSDYNFKEQKAEVKITDIEFEE